MNNYKLKLKIYSTYNSIKMKMLSYKSKKYVQNLNEEPQNTDKRN